MNDKDRLAGVVYMKDLLEGDKDAETNGATAGVNARLPSQALIPKKKDQFGEDQWGSKTRSWFVKTSQLDEARWNNIMEEASSYIAAAGSAAEAIQNGSGAVDPRTLVMLD